MHRALWCRAAAERTPGLGGHLLSAGTRALAMASPLTVHASPARSAWPSAPCRPWGSLLCPRPGQPLEGGPESRWCSALDATPMIRACTSWCLNPGFATQDRDALLLYNGRFNEKHDFIALEVVDGQVQLTFSAGETTTTVAPQVPGGVSDGRWHSVQVHYYNKVGRPPAPGPRAPFGVSPPATRWPGCEGGRAPAGGLWHPAPRAGMRVPRERRAGRWGAPGPPAPGAAAESDARSRLATLRLKLQAVRTRARPRPWLPPGETRAPGVPGGTAPGVGVSGFVCPARFWLRKLVGLASRCPLPWRVCRPRGSVPGSPGLPLVGLRWPGLSPRGQVPSRAELHALCALPAPGPSPLACWRGDPGEREDAACALPWVCSLPPPLLRGPPADSGRDNAFCPHSGRPELSCLQVEPQAVAPQPCAPSLLCVCFPDSGHLVQRGRMHAACGDGRRLTGHRARATEWSVPSECLALPLRPPPCGHHVVVPATLRCPGHACAGQGCQALRCRHLSGEELRPAPRPPQEPAWPTPVLGGPAWGGRRSTQRWPPALAAAGLGRGQERLSAPSLGPPRRELGPGCGPAVGSGAQEAGVGCGPEVAPWPWSAVLDPSPA
ncbi:Cadherin EGF LAG seven-pass G-type receptor 1 [Galemys pyrenaicus]|uniref:Cadherin EGF LAG seven-pass G-type receptor 1 n=1 Tax=Galemys pyrenaicus TaxID=202257 RepID=A0A8J6DS98_GALPY|nr:Cadherin EGF LAG seven-pass G-type receptor 1 [Galemys pyrenaicus]